MSFNWRATLSASVALIIVLSTAGAQISTMFSDQLIHDEYKVDESVTSSTSMDGINQAIAHLDVCDNYPRWSCLLYRSEPRKNLHYR